jgi:hypothetical protein
MRLALGDRHQVSQSELARDWVSERLIGVELVVVAPTDAYAAHVARVNKLREDAVDRPSRETGGFGHLPNPNLRILGERQEDARVARDENEALRLGRAVRSRMGLSS